MAKREFKINRKLILGIFIFELLLCSFELSVIIKHQGEWWPWFIPFLANFPGSIVALTLSNAVIGGLDIDSSSVRNLISFVLFSTVGTLWWSLAFHSLIFFYNKTANRLTKNDERPTE